ncbi:hypothetical protein FRC09_018288, partial [Ceratobasidium sp. 395]
LKRDLSTIKRTHMRRIVGELGGLHPEVPKYPEDRKGYSFTKKQHEIAAVLYRDHVERFLAWAYVEMKNNQEVSGKSVENLERLWENSRSSHEGEEPYRRAHAAS